MLILQWLSYQPHDVLGHGHFPSMIGFDFDLRLPVVVLRVLGKCQQVPVSTDFSRADNINAP
jgi:hypothetical protein